MEALTNDEVKKLRDFDERITTLDKEIEEAKETLKSLKESREAVISDIRSFIKNLRQTEMFDDKAERPPFINAGG